MAIIERPQGEDQVIGRRIRYPRIFEDGGTAGAGGKQRPGIDNVDFSRGDPAGPRWIRTTDQQRASEGPPDERDALQAIFKRALE